MIVKNEVRRIACCLGSVKALVDEMIVVDTGSTDGTARLAAQFGAKVYGFDFSDVDFAAARNLGLEQATGAWILVLDADEALDPRSTPLVRPCLAFGPQIGHFFARRNYNQQSERFMTDYVVRLSPSRPEYRYRGRVHETVDDSILKGGGRLQRTGIYLNHFFSQNGDERRRKNEWYIELLKEELAAHPNDDWPLNFLAAEYHQLGRLDLAAETAERIARVRPQDPQAHLSVGIYRLMNFVNHAADPQGAREAFEQALKLRPQHREASAFLKRLGVQEQCTSG
jgi:glycosyltransferase involved in cell wall biosynthesis